MARSARSASSRYARGNRSSNPPSSSRTLRRYAMSAVAHLARSSPATFRSQSVGRRPRGSGTRTRPWLPATSHGNSERSRSSAAHHSEPLSKHVGHGGTEVHRGSVGGIVDHDHALGKRTFSVRESLERGGQ